LRGFPLFPDISWFGKIHKGIVCLSKPRNKIDKVNKSGLLFASYLYKKGGIVYGSI
jgi:hypothetical protein